LHLHSRASGTATNWWVRGLGAEVEARESYTPPGEAYRMAKKAGMDFVTLTDHETIEGALTLTHHPDFLVGEEISAYLPEEGGYVDVLVYGLDAEVHREAQARRGDAHELVAYLRKVATLAVPLYDGLVLSVPSLLDVLEHVAEEDYDVLHVATPGPLGLAALVAGVVLSVPVVGAYHTEFGAYAEALSGDAFVAEVVDLAVREFYERCSAVAVPSQATALVRFAGEIRAPVVVCHA
jgi:hypothetical protein